MSVVAYDPTSEVSESAFTDGAAEKPAEKPTSSRVDTSKFYDCESLLSMKDANGDVPVFFIVCSRVRSAGKTFSFTKRLMSRFLEHDEKFILLCRTQTETGTVAQGMFKSMLDFEYPGYYLTEKKRQGGVYSDIYLNRPSDNEDSRITEHVGYVLAINAADAIKKISSNFTDADAFYFDEFQPEHMETYLKNEVSKFHLIYKSVARGGGASTRYVPIYMSSNTISVANPYFVQLGLSKKLQPDTKRVKGTGWVFQRATNHKLVEEHAADPFDRAMGDIAAGDFGDNSWLNDSVAGIGKPQDAGEAVYMGTLLLDTGEFGIRLYPDADLLYVNKVVDKTSPMVYRHGTDSDVTAQLLRGSDLGVMFRRYANKGAVRFHDQTCKVSAVQYLL